MSRERSLLEVEEGYRSGPVSYNIWKRREEKETGNSIICTFVNVDLVWLGSVK